MIIERVADHASRRRFLVDAGAVVAAAVVPRGVVLGQGESRKLIDAHHHFFPPAYQRAWLDWEDQRTKDDHENYSHKNQVAAIQGFAFG